MTCYQLRLQGLGRHVVEKLCLPTQACWEARGAPEGFYTGNDTTAPQIGAGDALSPYEDGYTGRAHGTGGRPAIRLGGKAYPLLDDAMLGTFPVSKDAYR